MLILILILTFAAASAAYFGLLHLLQRRSARRNREARNTLLARVRELDHKALARITAATVPMPTETVMSRASLSALPIDTEYEIPAEILAVIAETVAASCGQDARLLSVKRMGTPPQPPLLAQKPSVNHEAWVQEGRILIHASHEIVLGRTSSVTGRGAVTSLRGVMLETADCD